MHKGLATENEEKLFPREFYRRFITVRLSGKDLLLVKSLADVFCSGSYLENYHIIGATGQVMVAKAFGLRLNGYLYLHGDGGTDYLDVRVDTKTCSPRVHNPALLISRDPERWDPPKVFVLVCLKTIVSSFLEGNILGFITTNRIRSLVAKGRVRPHIGGHGKVEVSATDLFPISWLDMYLKCSEKELKGIMSQFLQEADLKELIQCIPPRSSCDCEDGESADLIEFLEF